MDLTSLRAKGVNPAFSTFAMLPGYQLQFNVEHFFRNEGGMANVMADPAPGACVHGVLHGCNESDLAALDTAEAYGIGYDRIEVTVQTQAGAYQALTYVGFPDFINDNCLPTERYLNILINGARSAGMSAEFIAGLRSLETLKKKNYPAFQAPPEPLPHFREKDLQANPLLTAIAGYTFDMRRARPRHEYIKSWFGGKDVTLFHLQRLDSSDGRETIQNFLDNDLTPAQRNYLNEYLHEFSDEYDCIGRFVYEEQM